MGWRHAPLPPVNAWLMHAEPLDPKDQVVSFVHVEDNEYVFAAEVAKLQLQVHGHQRSPLDHTCRESHCDIAWQTLNALPHFRVFLKRLPTAEVVCGAGVDEKPELLVDPVSSGIKCQQLGRARWKRTSFERGGDNGAHLSDPLRLTVLAHSRPSRACWGYAFPDFGLNVVPFRLGKAGLLPLFPSWEFLREACLGFPPVPFRPDFCPCGHLLAKWPISLQR